MALHLVTTTLTAVLVVLPAPHEVKQWQLLHVPLMGLLQIQAKLSLAFRIL